MKKIVSTLVAAFAAAALWATPVYAQHDYDAKPAEKGGHGHSAGEKHEAPATYAEAIAEIDEHLEGIQKLITAKKLDDVHAEAQEVVDIANTLAALALKPDSGVPKENIKEINKAAKELARKFDAIDKAGDSGDEAGVKEVLAEMTTLQATLKKATTDKFSVDIKPQGGAITAGKPATLKFTLKGPTGAPVTKLETVHEKILHLLMVSKDLSWYAHEHPVVQPDGMFTLTFMFPQGGDYILYHDFTPPGIGQQVVQVPLTVEGAAPATVKLTVDDKAPKTINGYTVSLDTGGPVKTGGETHLAFTITKDGKPVTTLAPYLGAMGHLVVISEDRSEFVHGHPYEEGAEHAAGSTGPKVDFEAMFMKPGIYKGWGQFNMGTKENEKIVTVPFTFEVKQGDAATPAKPHEHGK